VRPRSDRPPLPSRNLRPPVDATRERRLSAAYDLAQQYFLSKARVEPLLGIHEAQDLAGQTILEFEKRWSRVDNPVHYVRRMCRNNLMRFLQRKRQHGLRETLVADPHQFECTPDQYRPPIEDWCDVQVNKIHCITRGLSAAPSLTRFVVTMRVAECPARYADLESMTGVSEAALRMRFARFCKHIRNEYAHQQTSVVG